MKKVKTNSVGYINEIFPWLKENFTFFSMRVKGLKNKEVELAGILKEIDYYKNKYELTTGKKFQNASILEVGYGARPNRLIALMSLGYDVRGIDLDKPILNGGFKDFLMVYQKNGFKRTFKSFIRFTLFDKHERNALNRVLQSVDARLRIDEKRFLVGDASFFELTAESIDFIYSEDVFEHIPTESIRSLCKNLGQSLSPNGLALISPAIFSGIAGGHLVEWYPHTLDLDMSRNTEPWEHLRKRRYHADCYLNELRVKDFTEILKEYFELVEVLNIDSGLGKSFLTSEIRKELKSFDEDELLSHKWTFVCRKKVVNYL